MAQLVENKAMLHEQRQPGAAFWSMPKSMLFEQLATSEHGLTAKEATARLAQYGQSTLKPRHATTAELFVSQFKSPLILILIFAAILANFLGDPTNSAIVLAIVFVSGLLGFWQERGATNIVKRLLSLVQVKTTVIRDGKAHIIPVSHAVPGDIVILKAGSIIPGDCLIIESSDLFVDESTLTGEPFPVEKIVHPVPEAASIGKRINSLFMGTHVVSGSATAIVVRTGANTEFSEISKRIESKTPETEFETGVRKFGYLLLQVTLLLVTAIFVINVYFSRPVLESFLFALALAIGLTPQLLPAIISVNLAHGAKYMAQRKVVVKRLASIENFGSMNVLCADKTGTLTEGSIRVRAALDTYGKEREKVLLYAYLNAANETGFVNPIDHAIRMHRKFDISDYAKKDEVPYDFSRKRLSILLAQKNERMRLMVTKGAVAGVLAACSRAEASEGRTTSITNIHAELLRRFEELSSKGFRVLGVAYRTIEGSNITKDDEKDMTFLGFLVLSDTLKPGISETINELKKVGVSLKMVTGDNRHVAASIAKQVGLSSTKIVTGSDIRHMSDAALSRHVADCDVFAEIDPEQKERIMVALRGAGNVVGFLGDGINDAPALHAADVGISVDKAVDIAKESADIVLMEKDLNVLLQGVREGRRTFSNTIKYVFMATSANFGNMFSLAGTSLFLKFLPLLPRQVLLTNLMTDFPEMTIATDNVDPEMTEKPRKWDIKFIRKFMLVFGALSSVFDYLTFAALIFVMNAAAPEFRTGWFVESVVSAAAVVLIVRTRRLSFKSKPGKWLIAVTLAIIAATFALPFTPLAEPFGFVPLPVELAALIIGIVALYALSAEVVKKLFYKYVRF